VSAVPNAQHLKFLAAAAGITGFSDVRIALMGGIDAAAVIYQISLLLGQ
jgi:hypothetical protein